ncbi:MAG: hypothetical protein ACJ704_01025, partial [Nitrososphaeraceae archaeon]
MTDTYIYTSFFLLFLSIVVLHGYNSTLKPDSSHGSVLTAPVGQGKEVAISLVKTSSGTPINSGSM